jgi:glycerol-3-phosphate dehydrogenase (NAD(P)+)
MQASLNVLVLGHGEMGRAMAHLLADRATLVVWNRTPHPGLAPVMPEAAAAQADIVLCCLPTAAHAAVLARIASGLPEKTACLSVAKGLDERGRPVARILEAVLDGRCGYGVLHGPMIAEEILAGRPAFAAMGCRGDGVVARATALFAGTRLAVTASTDMIGINWAVVLKNVYAMAFGMADEIGLGDNVRGWLAATALAELDAIVRCMGGAPGTAAGLAGLGDLVTTATSRHSHHHELGRRLARGEMRIGVPGGIEGEAIRTLAALAGNALLDESGLPLFAWIHGVVRQPGDVARRFEALLSGWSAGMKSGDREVRVVPPQNF